MDRAAWRAFAAARHPGKASGVYSWGNLLMDENKQHEVTTEMMEAGFRVLATSGIADDFLGGDRLLVADIYRAMFAVRVIRDEGQLQNGKR